MALERPERIELDGRGRRVAVVAARFNPAVTNALFDGAMDALAAAGVSRSEVEVVRVPGAVEIPIAVQRLLARRDLDGVVAVGAVVRGGTPHFEYVSRAVTDGLMRVSLDAGTPVAFGVLTVDDETQARERAGGSHGNKGAEAAEALLETLMALEPL